MRFLILAVLALTLSMPAWAQTQGGDQPAVAPHNFGGLTCPQRLPCPDSPSGTLSASYLAQVASACVSQYMGVHSTNSDGMFDTVYGLDGNNCLKTVEDNVPKIASTKTIPHCCLIASQNACSFRCELWTTQ